MKAVSAPSVACALSIMMMAGITHSASAQSYDGCFVNGQQVADSMCQGGGGAGSAPSITSNPMYGNVMSMSRQLGGAIVKSLMAPPPQNAAPADNGAAAAAAEQQRQLKAQQDQQAADRAAADAAAQQEKRQFEAGRQNLLGEVRSIGGGGGDGDLHVIEKVGAFGAPELKVRAIGGSADAGHANADIVEPGEVLKDSLNNTPPKKPDDGFVPNPTARLDNVDPRSYPKLKSFTSAQGDAHDLNDAGVKSAMLSQDWRGAWGSFAAAYDRDPFGPFSKVIRKNMEIAERHLDQSQARRTGAAASANSSISSPASLTPRPIAAASPPPAAPLKGVLPKTYVECDAQFQTQTRTCQRADGSWDRRGCFDPAYVRLTKCVKGLTAASVH